MSGPGMTDERLAQLFRIYEAKGRGLSSSEQLEALTELQRTRGVERTMRDWAVELRNSGDITASFIAAEIERRIGAEPTKSGYSRELSEALWEPYKTDKEGA